MTASRALLMTEPAITEDTIVVVSDGAPLPAWLDSWLAATADVVLSCADSESVVAWALRARPRAIVLDGRCATTDTYALCERLKRDTWTAIVPIVLIDDVVEYRRAFGVGADEVLPTGLGADEATMRLQAMLRRSDRDTDVHPSTRLPGAREIEAELGRRLGRHELFAACYADLDHFKEFNDRYGFHEGNEVIRLVARLLHDVIKGQCGESGFVGHIGGDDFLYIVPIVAMPRVCDEVIRVFDELAPTKYSDADRRAGYFLGKDRRNQLYRVPLMTLSIGVVTNQHRRFARPADVSELATEMKSYAKTLPGSVWTLDRRRDDDPAEEARALRTREAVSAPAAALGGATVLPLRPRHAR